MNWFMRLNCFSRTRCSFFNACSPALSHSMTNSFPHAMTLEGDIVTMFSMVSLDRLLPAINRHKHSLGLDLIKRNLPLTIASVVVISFGLGLSSIEILFKLLRVQTKFFSFHSTLYFLCNFFACNSRRLLRAIHVQLSLLCYNLFYVLIRPFLSSLCLVLCRLSI